MLHLKHLTYLAVLLCTSFVNHTAFAAWYDGGTLHNANGLEWQKASYENKLATCGNFVASYVLNGKAKPVITQLAIMPNGLKKLSVEVVKQMDDAFKPEKDPEKNRQLFVNQKVRELFPMLMILMGWAK